MRSRKENDDIVHKIQETLQFYGKDLEKRFMNVWLSSLAEWDTEDIISTLDHHVGSESGRYAPRPADIIKLLNEKRGQSRWDRKYSQDNFVNLDEVECDPQIAKAWSTYMKFAHDFMMPGQKPDMPMDECLEIVNREAKKHKIPESIQPEHRIAEYWA